MRVQTPSRHQRAPLRQPATLSRALTLLLGALALSSSGCEDEPKKNPFDPPKDAPVGSKTGPAAVSPEHAQARSGLLTGTRIAVAVGALALIVVAGWFLNSNLKGWLARFGF